MPTYTPQNNYLPTELSPQNCPFTIGQQLNTSQPVRHHLSSSQKLSPYMLALILPENKYDLYRFPFCLYVYINDIDVVCKTEVDKLLIHMQCSKVYCKKCYRSFSCNTTARSICLKNACEAHHHH